MQHELVEKYIKELTRRNYSKRTISAYVFCVGKFIKDTGVNPYNASVVLLEEYLRNRIWSSVSQQNTFINALKGFYAISLGKKTFTLDKIERPFQEEKLPSVMDADFVRDRLSKIENIKHKAILTITFSVGLRVSEIVGLKIEDIDSTRMMIRIIQAKGKKDRYVPLSENTLSVLRQYFKAYRPKVWLFNGQSGGQYSVKSCQNVFKQLISEDFSIHALRHSCFTTLLECGTDITIIQKIAGHAKVETTQRYAKVSNKILSKVALPA
jgi:integrase/recombinase XerD